MFWVSKVWGCTLGKTLLLEAGKTILGSIVSQTGRIDSVFKVGMLTSVDESS